jgi:hypothetical protein
LDAALEKALSEHDWIDRDVAALLARAGVAWEEDRILYQAGDRAVPLADGVKLIAQTKPHLLKSAGAGGSGYKPGAGSAGGKPQAPQRKDFASDMAYAMVAAKFQADGAFPS